MTTPYAPVTHQMAEGCYREYKKSSEDSFKEKKEFDGKRFYEINLFKSKSTASLVAKDYKKCGYYTRILPIYGKYMLLVRRM